MLKISDHNHPEALEKQRNVVVLDEVVDTVVEITEDESYEDQAENSVDGTLDSFSGVGEHRGPGPEVRSIGKSNHSVNWVPTKI